MSKIYFVDEDRKNGVNYGRIEHDGKEYIFTDMADHTNRCLLYNNDELFEMSAPAVDVAGNEYTVYWIFEKDNEKELEEYDYNNIDRVVLGE